MLKKNKPNEILKFPGLTINLTNLTVIANEQSITLTPKEFQLLALLVENPNKVFSNELLFQSLWHKESLGDHRTIMVHISNIRKKIEIDPAKPVFIRTIKGAGYKFSIQTN